MSLLSKDNLKKIVLLCESRKKIKFTAIEVDSLIRLIHKLNKCRLKELIEHDPSMAKVNEFIVNAFISSISEPKAYDTKEMLKEQMDTDVTNAEKYEIESFESRSQLSQIKEGFSQQSRQIKEGFSSLSELLSDMGSLKDLTRILNRDSLLRDVNILFDSRYQNLSNQDKSKIAFTIVSETKNKSEGSGTIISSTSLRDIVEIEVFPFSIPFFADADNYYKKITMSILELSASSIDAYENSQFHFMFDIEKRLNLLYLTPVNNIFKFHKPISKLNEFTIKFGSPLATITFEKDRLMTSSINYSSNPMTIEFGEAHNLLSGDLIYFDYFETLDDPRNLAIISEITTSKGHTCSRINSTVISINVDATKIISPDLTRQFVIFLGSKRIMIPMRIRFIE